VKWRGEEKRREEKRRIRGDEEEYEEEDIHGSHFLRLCRKWFLFFEVGVEYIHIKRAHIPH